MPFLSIIKQKEILLAENETFIPILLRSLAAPSSVSLLLYGLLFVETSDFRRK